MYQYEETYKRGTLLKGVAVDPKGKEYPYDQYKLQPKYPGGIGAFYKYVGKRLKYPGSTRRQGIEGKVYVQFVVNENGSVSDVKVAQGLQQDADEEAIRVVQKAAFDPGRQRGVPVKVQMMMPIIFKLR